MKKITTVREFGADGTLVKETVTEEDSFVWNPPYPQTVPGAGQVYPNAGWPIPVNHGSHCACGRCTLRITCG